MLEPNVHPGSLRVLPILRHGGVLKKALDTYDRGHYGGVLNEDDTGTVLINPQRKVSQDGL